MMLHCILSGDDSAFWINQDQIVTVTVCEDYLILHMSDGFRHVIDREDYQGEKDFITELFDRFDNPEKYK